MSAIEWIDHGADVAFRVHGPTREDVFEQAARSVFSIMLDVNAVRPREPHPVEISSNRLDELLVEWLSEMLVQKDLSGRVFSRFMVRIEGHAAPYRLVGEAWGEPLDRVRHQPMTEVKGISYLGLQIGTDDNGRWTAQVVVDV